MKKWMIVLIIMISILPMVMAEDYFYVKAIESPYEVMAGEEFAVEFVLYNKELVAPKNVTAYIDPCPFGWECEEKTFSYEKEREHPENLTIKVGQGAIPKKNTMYVKLESYYPTSRGDDRFIVTVVASKEKPLTYEEYKEKEEEKEEPAGVYIPTSQAGGELISVEKADPEEIEEALSGEEMTEEVEEEGQEETLEEDEDKTITEVKEEVVENLERLESDRGFVEYATIVLLILLVVTGIGAAIAFRRKHK